MLRELLTGVSKVFDAAAAYNQHVDFVQRALGCSPQDLPMLMTQYIQGLSAASFTGFKLTLATLIRNESDSSRKAALQRLQESVDPARRGESVALLNVATPAKVDDFEQDRVRIFNWYETYDEGQRDHALAAYVDKLSADRYQCFLANLHQMRFNIVQHISQHEASENDAWGSSSEDRLAYEMARLKTGQRDPEYMRQLAHYQSEQQFVERLIRGSTLLWTERQKQKNAALPQARAPIKTVSTPPRPDAVAICEAVREFTRTGNYSRGADQLHKDISALVETGEADEVMAILEQAGGIEGGDKVLNISDHYPPGKNLYELRWPVAFPLPVPFSELDRATQFSVLFGEWSRRTLEADQARHKGDTAGAQAIYAECLARAEQIEVPELVARSHERLASVAFMNNQRSIQRMHLKLAVDARGPT